MKLFDRFRSTLHFFTRIPLGTSFSVLEFHPEQFPIVGALLGVALWGGWLLTASFPSFLRAVLLVIVWVVLTGGLHLDGWADTWESALYAGSLGDKLKIRKDPHVGAYGVLALVFLPVFKIACFSGWTSHSIWIIAIPLFSRGILPLSMKTLRFLNPGTAYSSSLGELAMRSFAGKGFYAGVFLTVLACGALLGVGGSLFIVAGWVGWVMIALFVLKRSDSLSGDFMGWSIEGLEAVSLFVLLAGSLNS
jgi:adenosylcobinamide-GDP ribazoletransferase